MVLSRRDLLAATAALVAAQSMPWQGREAQAAASDLRVVRFGSGFKSPVPVIINLLIGEGLGYNREEGFRLDPLWLGPNANVGLGLDKGDIQFGTQTGSFQLPLFAKGELPPIVDFYEFTYPYKWDVAVLPNSPIHDYADLKGRKIGVSGFGQSEYPVTRAILQNLGVNPDSDAKWVAVGTDTSAGTALQRGAIDALAYYDTGFGQIEGAGIELRMLPRPKDIPLIGGFFLAARRDFIAANRDLTVGFGRSAAKASEFILANPAAGAKVFLDMFPASAPRGASTAKAIETVLYQVNRRAQLFRPPYPETKMGAIRKDEIVREAEFLGLKTPDADILFTNDLIDDIHKFDVEQIRTAAKAFKV